MKENRNGVTASSETNPEIGRFGLPDDVPSLLSYYLYITNGCNLACRHCWITPVFVNGRPSPQDCLDVSLLKLAVREGKEIGLTNAKLTGGEPLLHPRFVEIVDYLSAENIRLNMETNGTLMTADLAKHLKRNTSMWFVSVSLDSVTPRKHDRFRGVDGAFSQAVDGIKNLVKAGFRPQIIICPHRENIGELEEFVKLAVGLGAGSVKFNPVTPSGRGKTMEESGETLNYDEIIGLVRFIKGELQDRTSIPLHIALPPALSTITHILRDSRAGGECRILNILGVLGDGRVALCGIGRNIPELCFGRLGRDDLRTLWTSHPNLVKLRKDLNGRFPGICGDCVHARRCLTHCAAMNYERSGRLISPYYLCEEAEKRREFPETRRKSFSPGG